VLLSTIAHALLFLALLGGVGAAAANALALALTAVANTAANRRLTFGVRGSGALARHHLQGLAVFGLALGLTSGVLWVLHRIDPVAGRAIEVVVLVGANLAATVLRYALLRCWVFARPDPVDRGRAGLTSAHPSRALWAASDDFDRSSSSPPAAPSRAQAAAYVRR
jgi:putative flippase GtrA